MFKNIKIGTRLSLGFLVIFLLLTSVTLVGINRMNMLSNQTTMLHDHPLTASNSVLHIEADILDIGSSMKDLVLAKSHAEINKAYEVVDALATDVYVYFGVMEESFMGERDKYENALTVYAEWEPIRGEVLALMLAGKRVEAAEIVKGKSASHVTKIVEALTVVRHCALDMAAGMVDRSKEMKTASINLMYILVFTAVALSAIFAIVLTRSITIPIRRLREATVKIGDGETGIKIEISSVAELSELVGSFNSMSEKLEASKIKVEGEITERKRAEEKLKTMSLTDELTGIYNRRGFFTFGELFLNMCKREGRGLFMLYGDLDNLKEINDTFGHEEGDNAIIDFAGILKENHRETDISARIGGDEFAVIPAGSTGDGAEKISIRLQKKIDAFNAKSDRKYKLSASVGIAWFDPKFPCSLEELLTRGDKLMYEQKKLKKVS